MACQISKLNISAVLCIKENTNTVLLLHVFAQALDDDLRKPQGFRVSIFSIKLNLTNSSSIAGPGDRALLRKGEGD